MTEPTLYPESGFCRLRIDLSYDGTNFSGWAIQPDRRTVQQVIEEAIGTVAQSKAETIVAGRTDAGVHATGQVIHVDVPDSLELEDLAYKLNRILDEDVRINQIQIAPPAFHARFSALRRYYEYRILDENKVIPPLTRFNTASWYRPLDLDQMNHASALLLGTHDFSAFRAAECQANSPVRTLTESRVHRQGDWLVFDFAANAFLQHMIRNLVGALVYVGKGAEPVTLMTTLLSQKDRTLAPPTFMPDGLYLTAVDYDAGWGLPSAGQTGDPLQVFNF